MHRASPPGPRSWSTAASRSTGAERMTMASDPRWAAVRARDAAMDDRFFYSVKTTGVYCRPSCAARLARFENVAFHSTTADAERAGFRPCKRCRPNEPPARERIGAQVALMCRLIEKSEE